VAGPDRRVGVVTDSTAYLDPVAASAAGLEVVPLDVVVGGVAHPETEVGADELAAALRRWTPVTTSRPSPAAMLAAYRRLAEQGVEEVVAVHLSSQMSGTCAGARLAARSAPVPVHVVDSGLLAMGLGYAALAAAAAAARGLDGQGVAAAAREQAAGVRMFFYVDTLEHLRRGGRIGAAQALLGSALAVKPLLHLRDGAVEPLERVRTSTKALARMADLAVAAVPGAAEGDTAVDVTVHHLANPDRARDLAERLREGLPACRSLDVREVGAVVGAHVGPGTVGVVVSPAVEGGAPVAVDEDRPDLGDRPA
jgi:DegV family protein with EDD domain